METIGRLTVFVAVWTVCATLNLLWLKKNPDVMAEEWRPALFILSPLASFLIGISLGYQLFMALVQRIANVQIKNI
jgi:hypothetical protein